MVSAKKSKAKTSIVGSLKRVTSWTCTVHYLQTVGNSAKWCSEAKIIHLLIYIENLAKVKDWQTHKHLSP